jgi:hypothetical protein
MIFKDGLDRTADVLQHSAMERFFFGILKDLHPTDWIFFTSFGNENIPIYFGCETSMILTHPKCFLIKGLGMGIKGFKMIFFFPIFLISKFW